LPFAVQSGWSDSVASALPLNFRVGHKDWERRKDYRVKCNTQQSSKPLIPHSLTS